jgi:hypothetical protein
MLLCRSEKLKVKSQKSKVKNFDGGYFMTHPEPKVVYEHLEELDRQADVAQSAVYREEAQEVLADHEVSLNWREKISDRLNEANNLLTVETIGDNESY